MSQPSPPRESTTLPEEPASTVAQKGAATLLRNKEQRRAERLNQIREQTADGTLVIRHMSDAEQLTASETAHATGQRNQARQRRYRSPGGPTDTTPTATSTGD
jgi:hypothetical protein